MGETHGCTRFCCTELGGKQAPSTYVTLILLTVSRCLSPDGNGGSAFTQIDMQSNGRNSRMKLFGVRYGHKDLHSFNQSYKITGFLPAPIIGFFTDAISQIKLN